MTAPSKQKTARGALDAEAEKLGEQLARAMRENDPKKDAAYEAAQAARDEAASKALAAHLKKRKK